MRFGLIPEFIGRLPIHAILEELDENSLVSILTEPKNALVKQYEKLFQMQNITLKFNNDAISEIAKKALLRKTGARGLRSILEHLLLEVMYELPSLVDVNMVVVTKEAVLGTKQPQLLSKEEVSKKCL